jgi:hypothetical protein
MGSCALVLIRLCACATSFIVFGRRMLSRSFTMRFLDKGLKNGLVFVRGRIVGIVTIDLVLDFTHCRYIKFPYQEAKIIEISFIAWQRLTHWSYR